MMQTFRDKIAFVYVTGRRCMWGAWKYYEKPMDNDTEYEPNGTTGYHLSVSRMIASK
jgi:hypothetical protein